MTKQDKAAASDLTAAEENAAAVQRTHGTQTFYCSRCRALRQRGDMVEDKSLGLVCAGGCDRGKGA